MENDLNTVTQVEERINDEFDAFAKIYLKDRLYSLIYTGDCKNSDVFTIVGNTDGKGRIVNLSNAIYCTITEYFMVNEREDQDLIIDINNLKNLLDRINYYI